MIDEYFDKLVKEQELNDMVDVERRKKTIEGDQKRMDAGT